MRSYHTIFAAFLAPVVLFHSTALAQCPAIDFENFGPGTFITTCPGHGDYSVDPPLTGEDVTCQSLIVNGEPVAITCTSQNPLDAIYYEIQ